MRSSRPLARLGLALLPLTALALGCGNGAAVPAVGHQLFTSPQVNAIALSEDGAQLLVANTTSGTLSIVSTSDNGLLAEIPVGIDPVGIAVRPKASEEDRALALVTNHISDSVSVIDLDALEVVQTIQELDAQGVTTTDAPTGVAFHGPGRAFVTLEDRNEVIVIDFDAAGVGTLNPTRLTLTAQAPRAVHVTNGRVYVAAFESGNQTELPICAPGDERGLDENDDFDEGCEFTAQVIESISILNFDPLQIDFDLDAIFDFAAVSPNIKGRIVRDRDLPDRDLFVWDADTLAPVEVLSGLGSLHYGLEAIGDAIYITQTEARNQLDGLAALDNRMFDNRLAILSCGASCGAADIVDLEANAFDVPVPTPYGIRASANGNTLVISVAGSDGIPGLADDPSTDIPGLITIDANGTVLGHVQTGAIPQSVALASDGAGAAQTAFVLNTVDSTVSVVDVSTPASPQVTSTFAVGSDPTPADVKSGRIQFSSARASTSGTFSCESCHPNGNMDQLLWMINTVEGPNDVPNCDPFTEECPEPRTTMPIRGLRDTLPLHWAGNLADPFPEGPFEIVPEDVDAPDCDIETDGEVGCARHLVNASLSGVMCRKNAPGCPTGPSGLPGALTDEERDAMGAFLMAVSFPPSPTRRPDDRLSDVALEGVRDFFTDDDRLGIGTASAGGIGNQVGFAPITCADNSGGCHSLPLTNDTNGVTVGRFETPSMRGMWDRWVLFSNGIFSAEEFLVLAQECADGNPPGAHPGVPLGILSGDPCALAVDPVFADFLPFGTLDPFQGVPSGADIWDPARGMTERGAHLATFEGIFTLAYGVRGFNMWEFFNEMSVGLPGLTGRQISLTEDNAGDAELGDQLAQVVAAAVEGRITASAVGAGNAEWRVSPGDGLWHPLGPGAAIDSAALRDLPADGGAVTVTARLPGGMSIGGADRQPLLDVHPDDREAEEIGDLLAIPEPNAAGGDTIVLGVQYVDPDAKILIDGELCTTCPTSFGVAPVTGKDTMSVTLGLALDPGPHVLQVLNPNGWMSNEMPVMSRFEDPTAN